MYIDTSSCIILPYSTHKSSKYSSKEREKKKKSKHTSRQAGDIFLLSASSPATRVWDLQQFIGDERARINNKLWMAKLYMKGKI